MKIRLFFLFYFCLLELSLYSQNSNFVNSTYTDLNGLPQNSIKDISIDDLGFIWLATENGLVNFNGKRFKVLKDIANSSTNRMENFYRDENGKLVLLNSKNEKFVIENLKLTPYTLKRNKYEYLPLDKELEFLPSFFHKTTDDFTYVYSYDEIDYFTRNDSAYVYKNQQQVARHHISKFKLKNSFGLEGRLLAVDTNFNFYEFDYTKNEYIPFFSTTPLANNFKIIHNQSSQQFFLCTDNQVFKIDFDFENQIVILFLVHDNLNVVNEDINQILYDEKLKITYFGSLSNALIVARNKLFTILKIENQRKKNLQYSFGFEGDTLISAAGLVFKNNSLIQEFSIDTEIKTFFVPNSKSDFFYHKFNKIYKKNIRNLDQEEEVFQFNSYLFAMYISELDHIYISTRNFNNQGISHLFRLKEDQKGTYKLDTITSLTSDISYILPKDEGALWLGTESGLFTYTFENKQVNLIPETENSYIRSLTNVDDRWWISTYNNGFFLYEEDKLTKIPISRNSSLLTSHHVLEDEFGGVWVSTNKGLFRTTYASIKHYATTAVNDITFYEFTTKDGLETNEFNGGCYPCSVKLETGELVFSSLNGIVKFHPKDFAHYFIPHKFYVDEVIINDETYETLNMLEFPEGKHNLQLVLNSTEFNRVSEYDFEIYNNGKFISKSKLLTNEFSWNGISSGNNEIRFGISDSDFVLPENSISIIVNPYYHEQLWFKFLVGFLFMGFVLLCFFIYHIKKNAKIKHVEALVAIQTDQIRQSINDLKLTKKELERQVEKQKKMIGAISHDIKSPLIYLGYGIEFLKEEIDDKDYPIEVKTNLNAINNAVHKLKEYTENILSFSKASMLEKNLTETVVDLNSLITSKLALFSLMAKIKKIEFIVEAKKQVNFKVNKNLLSLILHNLFDNAIKNTTIGYVKIELKKIGNKVIIKVKDTGAGMDKETLRKYIDLTSGKSSKNFSGAGIGLFIIAESLKMINATLSVESEKGKGTEAIVLLNKINSNE